MTLPQLYEISSIDSEIIELHEKLQSLYRQRAELTSIKDGASSVASQTLSDAIDLSGIDLSL